jgi:RNA polymerase sigma-70 factor (ECF subfamily)
LTRAQRRAAEATHLVEAAKHGDALAFDRLVRRFRPRIHTLALHLSGSPSDADDITQEVFLQAYRHIQDFEGRSEFFTWLYRITLNRALNARRTQGRRPHVPLDDPRVAAALEVDAGSDPRRQLELRETYTHLLRALDALSSPLKSTVVLTTLQGLSHREAAVVLGVSEGVVSWRLHEARKRLHHALERAQRRVPSGAMPSQQRHRARSTLSLELALALATR